MLERPDAFNAFGLAGGAGVRRRSSWNVSRADNAKDEAETIARMVTTDDAEVLIQKSLSR